MGMPIFIQQYKSQLCSHEQLIHKVLFDPNKFCSQCVKQFKNVLQKHDHKNVLLSNFHILHTSVLGSNYRHVKTNKCFLFL